MTDTETDELVFLPLGGCNEIGMNLNAYGYGPPNDRRWIIVDMGVTFGDSDWSGIDLVCADPIYLKDKKIDAIFLTHAHEDHIGAVGLLANAFDCTPKIYATPFTSFIVNKKMDEAEADFTRIKTIKMGSEVTAGPFNVLYVRLTHSIPEPSALAIRTPLGTILHTGDWKIDPEPMIGQTIDEQRLEKIGKKGVLAMVCDSTNVFEEGEAGSESTVAIALEKLIAKQRGRVVVTTFASNVARVKSVLRAAEKANRRVCLLGRSMHNIYEAAVETKKFKKVIKTIGESAAASLPADKVLYLCTGSQGEPRAALTRVAFGRHRQVKLGPEDTVIFSSRVIPGNEERIYALHNAFADRGIHVITDSMEVDTIHVSGHPCRDELQRMYRWIRPRISVPVHGERRHVIEHARFAKTLNVPNTITPRNGELVRLAPRSLPLEVIETVQSGRLYKDGSKLLPANSPAIRERNTIARNGYIHVSAVLDDEGDCVIGPHVVVRGLAENDGRIADESVKNLEELVSEAFENYRMEKRLDDDVHKHTIKFLRNAAYNIFGKRPFVDLTLMEDVDYE